MTLARVIMSGLAILIAAGGCAHKAKAPPVPLVVDAEATLATLSATVHSVIVVGGPGQWTEHAAWDELIVTVKNLGEEAITLERAILIDCTGTGSVCDNDARNSRYLLVQRSRENLERYRDGSIPVRKADFPIPVSAQSLLAGGLVSGVPGLILGPIAMAAMHARVQREMRERRLTLPVRIEGRSAETGSWFFPISAGPQLLVLEGTSAGGPVRLEVPLPKLAKVHLNAT
jgi:hypothetical protein